MKVSEDIKLDFSDVLILPKSNFDNNISSRNDVTLEREFYFTNSKQNWKGVPIAVANMDTTGTIEMARELQKHKILTCLHKFYDAKDIINSELDVNYYAISSGTKDEDINKLETILEKVNARFICLDVANGYLPNVIDKIKLLRSKFPSMILIAGNVVTAEIVNLYYESGVDIVKMGIGSGSVCTTRLKTGIGYPQFSCILDCRSKIPKECFIMSDGGIQQMGDVSKAYGAGADFVMCGGIFAGHEECSGETIEEDDKKYKVFYGMSSSNAMKTHYGSVASYRSSEGKCVKIKYRGPIINTIQDMLGGIRSTMTYVGVKQLVDLYNNCEFIRVNHNVNTIYNKNEI